MKFHCRPNAPGCCSSLSVHRTGLYCASLALALMLSPCLASVAAAQVDLEGDHYTGDDGYLGGLSVDALSTDYLGVYGAVITGNNGTAEANIAHVDGGNITEDIAGAWIDGDYGTVADNIVVIDTVNAMKGNVFGGHAEGDYGIAIGNSVTILGGTYTPLANPNDYGVYGGRASGQYGEVENNSVTIFGGAFDIIIFGGETADLEGLVNNNSVTISGGTFTESVYGGFGSGDNTSVLNNIVSISGGTFTPAGAVENYGVYGGRIDTGVGLKVSGNILNIDSASSTFSTAVYGGQLAGNGDVTNNTINIAAGAFSEAVYGGFAGSDNSTATGNTVNITGGSFALDIYGGFVLDTVSNATIGTATDNTINISGDATFTNGAVLGEGVRLFGGRVLNTGGGTVTGDFKTGNTLSLASVISVRSVHNFANYLFTLSNVIANGDTMLTTSVAAIGDPADDNANIADSTITLQGNYPGGGSVLAPGFSVTLMDKSYSATGDDYTLTSEPILKGVSLLYNFELERDATTGAIIANLVAVNDNPRAKALVQGQTAALGFMNLASDLVSGLGVQNALAAARQNALPSGWAVFAAGIGGSNRYQTGSHVDLDGISLLAGVAREQHLHGGSLLLGAFVEAGWSCFDSYNDFADYDPVRAKGHNDYYGLGLLAQYAATSGLHLDASFRAGRVYTDFNSTDLFDINGSTVSYESKATYYGAHLTLGYLWEISERLGLDLYTRYLWTHLRGDSFNVLGDPIEFDSITSQRWRTGLRLDCVMSEQVAPYVGLAYEYEFAGETSATAYGYGLESSSLRGGSGIAELGASIMPSANSGFSVDLGVQGYWGTRRGVTGSLHFKYVF